MQSFDIIIEQIKEKIINEPIKLIIILSIISILFICFGHKFRDDVQVKLQKTLFVLPSAKVDYWSISHFILFLLFGFIYPNHPLNFVMIGISWELIEDYLASDKNKRLADCTIQQNKNTFWCMGIQDDYWYGKWDDIIFNTFGYLVGQALRNRLDF